MKELFFEIMKIYKTQVRNAYIKSKGKSKPGEKLVIAFSF